MHFLFSTICTLLIGFKPVKFWTFSRYGHKNWKRPHTSQNVQFGMRSKKITTSYSRCIPEFESRHPANVTINVTKLTAPQRSREQTSVLQSNPSSFSIFSCLHNCCICYSYCEEGGRAVRPAARQLGSWAWFRDNRPGQDQDNNGGATSKHSAIFREFCPLLVTFMSNTLLNIQPYSGNLVRLLSHLGAIHF